MIDMHSNKEKERKLDVALGLTILGETYPHDLDELGICRYCTKINTNGHGICMVKVPHYSTQVADASKVFSRLINACNAVTIVCESEDKQHWMVKFEDQTVKGSSLAEVMWKSTAIYFNTDMTEILET